MNTANLTLLNPIEQIMTQKLEVQVSTEERSYFETDISLCEDDQISIDVCLEIYLDWHPGWNRSYVKKIKAHFLSAYDGRECEDVELTLSQKRKVEKYISENLTIKIN